MNVLYATTQDLRRPGGARSHVLGFCKALENLGVTVRIMSPYGADGAFPAKRGSFLGRADHLFKVLRMRSAILKCLVSGWPEVAYFRKGLLDPGLFFALRAERTRVLLEVNGVPKQESFNTLRYMAARASGLADKVKYRKADLVVAVSEGLRKDLLAKYESLDPEKVIVVNNGVDTDFFYPKNRASCRMELGIDPGWFVAVFSGRIARWHGLDSALEAVSLLERKHPGKIRLYVLGEGPAASELKNNVRARGLQESVVFTGMVSTGCVSTYIGAADVCLAPFTAQRNDAIGISPLKIFEYVACRRPVIASRVRGLAEIAEEVGEGSQITLVNPDDGPALATALERALQLPVRKTPCLIAPSLYERISWEARAKVVYGHIKEKSAK